MPKNHQQELSEKLHILSTALQQKKNPIERQNIETQIKKTTNELLQWTNTEAEKAKKELRDIEDKVNKQLSSIEQSMHELTRADSSIDSDDVDALLAQTKAELALEQNIRPTKNRARGTPPTPAPPSRPEGPIPGVDDLIQRLEEIKQEERRAARRDNEELELDDLDNAYLDDIPNEPQPLTEAEEAFLAAGLAELDEKPTQDKKNNAINEKPGTESINRVSTSTAENKQESGLFSFFKNLAKTIINGINAIFDSPQKTQPIKQTSSLPAKQSIKSATSSQPKNEVAAKQYVKLTTDTNRPAKEHNRRTKSDLIVRKRATSTNPADIKQLLRNALAPVKQAQATQHKHQQETKSKLMERQARINNLKEQQNQRKEAAKEIRARDSDSTRPKSPK